MESEETRIYQIWIEPNKLNVEPSWDSAEFPTPNTDDRLTLLVAGDDSAPLTIHQDARIYAGNLVQGTSLIQNLKHQGYLLVSEGSLKVGDITLKTGDGIEAENQTEIEIKALTNAKLLLIDAP